MRLATATIIPPTRTKSPDRAWAIEAQDIGNPMNSGR